MINNEMSIIWITLNSSNFWSYLVLIFAKVQLGDSGLNVFNAKFRQAMAIMNLLAII